MALIRGANLAATYPKPPRARKMFHVKQWLSLSPFLRGEGGGEGRPQCYVGTLPPLTLAPPHAGRSMGRGNTLHCFT